MWIQAGPLSATLAHYWNIIGYLKNHEWIQITVGIDEQKIYPGTWIHKEHCAKIWSWLLVNWTRKSGWKKIITIFKNKVALGRLDDYVQAELKNQ